jgi:RNA polymerase sigma-70 factor (ECF subfamily)
VEQQRLIVHQKVLIEAESTWQDGDFDRSADPIDPSGNLVDSGSGLLVRNHNRKCNDLAQRYTSKVESEEDLCRSLAPRIRLYGLRHLRDEQAAADLVQQVLLITLESLRAGKVRDLEKIPSFVLGACRMVVLDIRRGGARRERLLEQYLPPVSTFPDPAPDLDRLAECLGRLPERERSVVVMTFYEEHSSEFVAGALGLSNDNVRVIRHRALGRLRKCMTGGLA